MNNFEEELKKLIDKHKAEVSEDTLRSSIESVLYTKLQQEGSVEGSDEEESDESEFAYLYETINLNIKSPGGTMSKYLMPLEVSDNKVFVNIETTIYTIMTNVRHDYKSVTKEDIKLLDDIYELRRQVSMSATGFEHVSDLWDMSISRIYNGYSHDEALMETRDVFEMKFTDILQHENLCFEDSTKTMHGIYKYCVAKLNYKKEFKDFFSDAMRSQNLRQILVKKSTEYSG